MLVRSPALLAFVCLALTCLVVEASQPSKLWLAAAAQRKLLPGGLPPLATAAQRKLLPPGGLLPPLATNNKATAPLPSGAASSPDSGAEYTPKSPLPAPPSRVGRPPLSKHNGVILPPLPASAVVVPLPDSVVDEYVVKNVADPFLQALGKAALKHDAIMDANFAYHDSVHARTVARGAKKYAGIFAANKVVQDVAFVAGLFHDTGYEEAVIANGYKLPGDAAFDWKVNTVKTAFPANKKHEEFSLCWALKEFNTLLADPKWHAHKFAEGVDMDEVIGMIWAGIIVTKVSGPDFADTVFKGLASVETYTGPNQPEFKTADEGTKCKIGDQIKELYKKRTTLKDKLTNTFHTQFKAVKKGFGAGNPFTAEKPVPDDLKSNIQLVTLAMRAADFHYYTEPGSVCISENCRMEWSLYGGARSMLFASPPWTARWDAAATAGASFAEKQLLLAELFWKDGGGNSGFIEKMTKTDNPVLAATGSAAIDLNKQQAEAIVACLDGLMKNAGLSAEAKLTEFKTKCIQAHCTVSKRTITAPKTPKDAGAKHEFEQFWTTYGSIYEPKIASE